MQTFFSNRLGSLASGDGVSNIALVMRQCFITSDSGMKLAYIPAPGDIWLSLKAMILRQFPICSGVNVSVSIVIRFLRCNLKIETYYIFP